MELISGKELENSWPFESFKEAYQDMAIKSISKCFAIVKGDGSTDPDKTALVFIRLFIEKGFKARRDQKYIAGLRFYGFGDMATLDIISLSEQNHRDIAREHAKRLDWLISGLRSHKTVSELYNIPILITGAHLKVNKDDAITTFGNSGDFGNHIFGTNINKLVDYVLSYSLEGSKLGNSFMEEILSFMIKNKRKQDFYEKLIKHYIMTMMSRKVGQNIGSLLTMKVMDRALKEGKNPSQLVIEELEGFVQEVMATYVSQKMKVKYGEQSMGQE